MMMNTNTNTNSMMIDTDYFNNNNNNYYRKRPFSHCQPPPPPPPTDKGCMEDGVGFVKLYVAGIPRTSTREQLHSVFGVYGNIVEIALLRDKRTSQPKECCFVKYTTVAEGDKAIAALNNQYYFPGTALPIKVRYADGERDRPCHTGNHVLKLYVNGLNKHASKVDISEIFCTYGIIEDIHIVRDEFQQSRGFGFVQFTRTDMAVAAINALNGKFFMEGCNQPLLVRFADPKKPRIGNPRNNSKVVDSAVGSHFQEPVVRPVFPNNSMAGNKLSNVAHSFTPKTTPSSSQSPRIGGKSNTVSSSPSVSEPLDSLDSDWSEHTCPDGYKYYYNCVSCESRWEKPREFSLIEQQLQKQHVYLQQRQQSELDNAQVPARPSPLAVSTCG